MQLTPMARQLITVHARRPSVGLYGTEALGGGFRPHEMDLLDKAYRELERKGMIKATGQIVPYFGGPRKLYKLTIKGLAAAKEPVA